MKNKIQYLILPSPNLSKIVLFVLLGTVVIAGSVFVGIKIGKNRIVNPQSTTTFPSQIVTNSTIPSLEPSIIIFPTVSTAPISKQENLSNIARRLFVTNLEKGKLSSTPIGSRLTDYLISSININPNITTDKFCFNVTYSVKPFDINVDFIAGNGNINKSTEWIYDKYAFVIVKRINNEYMINNIGTGGVCE